MARAYKGWTVHGLRWTRAGLATGMSGHALGSPWVVWPRTVLATDWVGHWLECSRLAWTRVPWPRAVLATSGLVTGSAYHVLY